MEYYQVAAKWWADKLREIKVENFSIGEEGTIGYIAQLMGYMIAKESKPTEDAINSFESILAQEIKQNVEQFKHAITLEVDYHPERRLCYAAKKANLDANCLPKMVVMRADQYVVTVRVGGKHGSELVLYQSPEYLEMMDLP